MTFAELEKVYRNKKVFLTGHTGFKGAWMLQILQALGTDVKGYSLAPENSFDLYNQINGDELCYSSVIADINNTKQLQGEIVRFEPDFVFHLAAQALVRKSYESPIDTFQTNIMGTAHVLEALRYLNNPCVGVMITTDKVYENPENGLPFQEQDKLGGYDPYSASKAAAEIVIDSYRRSYFNAEKYSIHQKTIASVRAGNVIGGGDYAQDRIIPDLVRAIQKKENVVLRNPNAIRPWQHVIEPIIAYLQLGALMSTDPLKHNTIYNIGPEPNDNKTVESVTQIFLNAFGNPVSYEIKNNPNAPHEAGLLILNNAKAKLEMRWQPLLNATKAVEWTADWYADNTKNAKEKCQNQIETYFSLLT